MRAMSKRWVAVFALLAGCGSSAHKAGFDPGAGSLLGGGTSDAGDAFGDGGASGAGCAAAATLVYVVTQENDLYSFAPATLAFTRIGALGCSAAAGAYPFSMAVDRGATAWVNYSDGTLHRVSTADATCTKTSFVPQQGFSNFGMGFSSDAPKSTSEKLFLCGFQGAAGQERGLGLAQLDVASLTVTPIGDFTGPLRGNVCELTGSGDAKLFGFYVGSPAMLADIDKASGATPTPKGLSGLTLSKTDGFAFSFWGGDFWFYTSQSTGRSQVTRFKAATDQSLSVVVPDTGFTIVGAGVSTCAPTTPVK
jgi:hypothetical protein